MRLQRRQPAGLAVMQDRAQVRRVHQPGRVGGGELGERGQMVGHLGQLTRVGDAAAQDGGGERPHRRAAGLLQIPGAFSLDQYLRLGRLGDGDDLLQRLRRLVRRQQPRGVDQALRLLNNGGRCCRHDPIEAGSTGTVARVEPAQKPLSTTDLKTLPKAAPGGRSSG
jgi:hypothetical protein